MSETPETPDTAPEDTAVEQPDSETPADDGNAEAAKWRRKLREAEKARDDLVARLDAVQRQQVEQHLDGVKPEALWAVTELADLLDEAGVIDPEKIAAAVDTAREKFGIAKTPKGNRIPGVGNRPSSPLKVDAWREAFTPAGRKR